MLTLYYAPNTCALASLISLEEAGARYETVRLSFADGEQRKPRDFGTGAEAHRETRREKTKRRS